MFDDHFRLHAGLRRLSGACLLGLATLGAWAAEAGPGSEPIELRFSQFFKQPIGPRGLELGETLHAADGREVQIRGYMVVREMPRPGRFWLTALPIRLSEHADGEADDLPPAVLTVLLDPAQRERFVAPKSGLMSLRGRLSVGREEDESGRVSWVRLQLPPDALETAASAAPTGAHAH